MQTINLNQNSFRLFPTIYMVQNDTGRELKMILDDVTLTGTETGAVAIHRSDGSYYTITATIDTTNNAFDADMTQALTQPSRTECQLKVTASDDTVISTYTFIIMVQPSTDGVPAEQLGVTVDELMEAATQLTLSDNDVKLALLQIAEKVVYIDPNGQDYYDALEDALYPPIRATSVTLDKNSLVFSGIGGTDTLVATVSPNNVEDDTVYWGSSDKDVAVVSDGIVTAVGNGHCTITATCGTVHASASVDVSSVSLVSISASYTQTGTVYSDGTLDDILTEGTLVVTATWSDSSQTTLTSSDYTLTGTLDVGTDTITVTYGDKSDTFSVVVTLFSLYTLPVGEYYHTGGLFTMEITKHNHVRIYKTEATSVTAARLLHVRADGTKYMGNATNYMAPSSWPTWYSTVQGKTFEARCANIKYKNNGSSALDISSKSGRANQSNLYGVSISIPTGEGTLTDKTYSASSLASSQNLVSYCVEIPVNSTTYDIEWDFQMTVDGVRYF